MDPKADSAFDLDEEHVWKVSNRAEIMPRCLWVSDLAIVDSQSTTESSGKRTNAYTAGSESRLDSRGLKITLRKARVDLEDSAKTLNPKPKVAPPSFDFPGEDTKHFNKAPNLGSGLQAVEAAQGFSHGRGRIIPSLSNERQGGFFYKDNHMNPRRTAQAVHGHNHFGVNKKYSSHKTFEVSRELVYGPRASKSNSCLDSSTRNNNLNQFVRRDKYNKTDFQIEYENAKFFMIKSYNEDDVHKSVKYNVWASTPYGNKKLDAVFWDAERLMKQGSKCPIFLFFSVNASGQFVGLAEMIGPVDFNKNLDFWQKETWNGFFPVKWHIIKDIPNRLFQSITLENNDNKAVTFSKDTQEIGLPQGLQMLHIFKGHPQGTSLLDDFGFYEQREKSLRATRRRRPAVMDVDFEFYDDSSVEKLEAAVSEMNVTGKSRKPCNLMWMPSSTRGHSNHSQARN